MPPFNNLKCSKFGRLTVLEQHGYSVSGNAIWRCKCDCGNEVSVTGGHLVSGATRSCGCLRKEFCETLKEINRKTNQPPRRLKDGKGNPKYEKINTFRRKERRDNYRNNGLCPRCGGAREDKSFSKCSKCREHNRDYARSYIIGSTGRKIYGRKRSYPGNLECELCGRKKRLSYHHWDDKYPEKGIWVCVCCHIIAEYIEKGFFPTVFEKFTELRKRL